MLTPSSPRQIDVTASATSDGTSGTVGRLKLVRDRIVAAAHSVKREASSVELIAVSKTFEAPSIRPLLAAGQRHFGENRVQEAQSKWPQLREEFPDRKSVV